MDITVQQAIDELAYYNKVRDLEEQQNFEDHFLGQVDKDSIVDAGKSIEIGDTNFLDLMGNISDLKRFPGAPIQAIDTLYKYFEDTMVKMAMDRIEMHRPNLFLQQEIISFLKKQYTDTFKIEFSYERHKQLQDFYNEMNPAVEPKPVVYFKGNSEDDDSLPF